MLRGDEAMEAAIKQEKKLAKQSADLEERRRHQQRLESDIRNKKEESAYIKEGFTSKKEELKHINDEIERIHSRHVIATSEMEDMQEVIHREREDLMERIRELTREIRLKHLIID